MGDLPLPTVLVTGFGPFRNHTQNASWLTVQELQKLHITDFKLVTKELAVAYDEVREVVPELWRDYNPKLTVHCGLCEGRSYLSIETVARNKSYCHSDIKGQIPINYICAQDGPDIIKTDIDISKVLEDLSYSNVCVKTESSCEAGLYLCEFIYYTSLKINRNTVFVHIPPIDQPYSAKEMAQTLLTMISSMLKQLH